METLLIKFRVRLTDFQEQKSRGPLFHRWLPNGEEDAIEIDTGYPDYKLEVWFDRWNFAKDSTIDNNDVKREEFDEKDLLSQGALDAGFLLGRLEIENISDSIVQFIREDNKGNEEYVQLAKQLLNNVLYPKLSGFVNTLRFDYGQYWLNEIPEWDSRERSLGDYYRSELHARWSLDGGNEWHRFIPNDIVPKLNMFGRSETDYEELLTQDDWRRIEDRMSDWDGEPSLNTSETLFVETHRLLDQEKYKQAFIRNGTLLEITTEEKVNSLFDPYGQGFSVGSLRTKLGGLKQLVALTATLLGNNTEQEIKDTVRSIEIRNKIVHENEYPADELNESEKLSGSLEVAKSIMGNDQIKLPKYLKLGIFEMGTNE